MGKPFAVVTLKNMFTNQTSEVPKEITHFSDFHNLTPAAEIK